MEVVGRLLALLVMLLVGAGLRTTGILDRRRTELLNAVAYYVALPALIFVSTYDRSIGDLLSPALLAGLLVVLFTTAGLAALVHRNRNSRARRSVAIVQSYHSNLGYLGLPLVAATFDASVTAIASVVLGVVTLTQLPLTILVLSTLNGTDASIARELRGLATNPILATLIAGLAVGSLRISIPSSAATGLDAVGSLALPVALLCVGASLQVDAHSIDAGATAAVVALKICLMPALAWAVFFRARRRSRDVHRQRRDARDAHRRLDVRLRERTRRRSGVRVVERVRHDARLRRDAVRPDHAG